MAPIDHMLACAVAAAAGSAVAVAFVAMDRGPGTPTCFAPAGSARIVSGTGRVVAVDLGQSYLTIRHREMQRLEMPEMEMMFAVQDRRQLERLQPSDRIRFTIDTSDMSIANILMADRGE